MEEEVIEKPDEETIEVSVPVPDPPEPVETPTVIVNPPAPEPDHNTVIVEDKRNEDEHTGMHEEHERRHEGFESHITERVDEIRAHVDGHKHDEILERILNIEETLKPDESEKDTPKSQSTDEPTIIEPDVPKLQKPEQRHWLRKIGF